MFYIDQTTPEFLKARQEHFVNARYVILKKLLGKKFKEPHPKGLNQKIDQVYGIDSQVRNLFRQDAFLRDLLIGPPEWLDRLKDTFSSAKAIKSVKALIRYDAFSEKNELGTFRFYNGFHLADNLGLRTCIYCNRAYIKTVINDRREFVARPTFDHWFPQGRYPILALSFYNLIPSCSVCNMTIKGANEFAIGEVFHPYLRHPEPERQLNFRFSYDLEDHIKAKSRIVTDNTFSETSIDAMKLRAMYDVHNEDIRDLIYLKRAYGVSGMQSLEAILKMRVPTEDVYRLLFGVYFEDDMLHTRPLSKLKKDILTELGIV